jgi:hypothetical protein
MLHNGCTCVSCKGSEATLHVLSCIPYLSSWGIACGRVRTLKHAVQPAVLFVLLASLPELSRPAPPTAASVPCKSTPCDRSSALMVTHPIRRGAGTQITTAWRELLWPCSAAASYPRRCTCKRRIRLQDTVADAAPRRHQRGSRATLPLTPGVST